MRQAKIYLYSHAVHITSQFILFLSCGLILLRLSCRRESGQLLVQSENGSIGLVHEKNLDFSKKALQKRAG